MLVPTDTFRTRRPENSHDGRIYYVDMAAEFDGISQLVKSGPRRGGGADELMQAPTLRPHEGDALTRHLRGAMYLAGYAIECLLKAYLTEQERGQRLSTAERQINDRRAKQNLPPIEKISSSAAGHSLAYLLGLTDLAEQPDYDPALWGRVAVWRSVWRYDPSPVKRDAAEAFVEDVRTAVNWLSPRILRL